MFVCAVPASACLTTSCRRWLKTKVHIHKCLQFLIPINDSLDIFVLDCVPVRDLITVESSNVTNIIEQAMTRGNKRVLILKIH